MINGKEIANEHIATINLIDALLSRGDLNEVQRKAYQELRDDCVWFVRHLGGEEGDCYD